jgi:predicted nucleic acid-binding protein
LFLLGGIGTVPILPEPQVIVLDSSALLIYLADEEGAGKVQRILEAASHGQVDVVSPPLCFGEALAVVAPSLTPERLDDLRAAVERLPVETAPIDLAASMEAAIAGLTWDLGIADAAAAVLAQHPGAILLTANPQFERFAREVGRVYWLGAEDHRNELVLFDPLARF